MLKAYEYEYRGYILRCRPQPAPSGAYLPFVVVVRDVGVLQAQASITADLESFERVEDAAEIGRAAGQAWVDKHDRRETADLTYPA